ncbi:MAG: D-glycerate dehydrogenase [Candidatus Yanofskybacteria bacterium RIFCSPLOWO2_01_FULL_41_34]|uniref:D-glycerate dehydrogenase n=1 Tax=Candidatus Yanofskybacteria bacterium RIFCSPHIGHO2_01_FULL_41_26 TaxID=1802661 RepID=A0A1F8EDD9_9BACT|nr:MAG: D-glycerate dehydrogenase [Candidatus Yanofskybacteria bacterium RIFCSPHIGHO2_01_FULL_41_26]OGN21917.1 MAG: D-glycerate dehydrogenase [Candidatus Yanofskybacteria bacterium RIFCSPLOWO2_01_FULL_41_34]
MPKIFITRMIPKPGIELLTARGYEIVVSPENRVLSKEELVSFIKGQNYDAVLCLLTDRIDADVLGASLPTVKIFANFAVGFDNIDKETAKRLGIMITNTPDVLTDTVAEHTFALMLAIAHRVVEADKFVRADRYEGWAPMLLLGADLSRKTLGIVGLGRIGSRVAFHAVKGFDMKVIYYDVKRNEEFEKMCGAVFTETIDGVLREADFISIHVPLIPQTHHLIGEPQFKLMKPTAYLVNTSRGPIIDETALAEALNTRTIAGAALDVFEFEPKITPSLLNLNNVILTPHIASATEETRAKMSELAAANIIEALEGRTPPDILR